uniref:Uncharacterized protein n=1 Tax=Rhizophora mucronata TaxID=61149 RepID=A0A2P2ITP4_RHIMU
MVKYRNFLLVCSLCQLPLQIINFKIFAFLGPPSKRLKFVS